MYMLAFALSHLVVAACQSAPSQDRAAEKLLDEAVAATRGVKALEAKFTVRDSVSTLPGTEREVTASVRLKRPFFGRIDIEIPQGMYGPRPAAVAADGMRLWTVHRTPEGLRYSEAPIDAQGRGLAATSLLLVDFWCDPRPERLLRGPGAALRLLGPRTVDGQDYRVLEASVPGTLAWRCELFVDKDGLVRRLLEDCDVVTTSYGPDGKKQDLAKARTETVLAQLATSRPARAADFTWKPPEGASPLEGQGAPTDLLLDVGAEAPAIEVPRLAGGQLSSTELRRGRKALLVLFWHCPGADVAALAALEKIDRDLRAKGLAVLAVNLGDTRKVIDHFLEKRSFAFDIGLTEEEEADFGMRRAWGITGSPAAFLVDDRGRIAWRALPFREEEVRKALDRLGIR